MTTDYTALLNQEIQDLKSKVAGAFLPDELRLKAEKDIVALERSVALGSYDEKYDKVSRYIEWIVRIPWEAESDDQLDLEKTKQVFETHHYGMHEVKNRFLEYVSILKLRKEQLGNSEFRAPVLLLVGLVGTGKNDFCHLSGRGAGPATGAHSLWWYERPHSSCGGSSRLHLESEPGRVVKGLCEAGVRNPVILLDEIDRVAQEANRDIMGVLVELLDPAQNHAFRDAYVDYPTDLSRAIFIATANNTGDIATAVMDRLEKIAMPSYTDDEKIVIAQRYVLPGLLADAGIRPEQLVIDDEIWPAITRPLGYDAGIRTLQRTLQGAVRKAARIMVEKGYENIHITAQNKNIFLPQY